MAKDIRTKNEKSDPVEVEAVEEAIQVTKALLERNRKIMERARLLIAESRRLRGVQNPPSSEPEE